MQTIMLPDTPCKAGEVCELSCEITEPGTLQGLELATGLALEEVHVGNERYGAIGWQGNRIAVRTLVRFGVRNSTAENMLAHGVLAFAPVPREVVQEAAPPLQIPQTRIPVGPPQGVGAVPMVVEAVMVEEHRGQVQGLAAPAQIPQHSHVLGLSEGARQPVEMSLAPMPHVGLEPGEAGYGIPQGYAPTPPVAGAEAQTLRHAVVVRPGMNEKVVLLTSNDILRLVHILRGQEMPHLNPANYGDIALKLDGALRSGE